MKELTGSAAALTGRRWWALAVLCLSLVVITVDTTILNVALPSLVSQLHATASELEWIVDAYIVVFAGMLLFAGSLGDRFGRRGALSIGLIVFGAACVGAALSNSAGVLIGFRALTGLGAALVFPATLSLLTNIFTDPTERQRAIAVWAGTAGVGIAIGPVAGGLLLRHFAWGSIFWVNVPVCLIALVAGRILLPPSKDSHSTPLDLPGAVLSVVGLSSLVYAIIEGPGKGWTSDPVIGAFLVAALALGTFIAIELHRRDPMLDLRLFRNPRFSAASLAVTALYFCLFGTIFFQTQFLQSVLGYDPLGAGVRSVPFAVVLLIVANTTPPLVRRLGTRTVITAGLGVVAASMALRAGFTVHSGYTDVLTTQCLFAFGMGLTIAPATASIMGAVPPDRAGVGSAVNDTTRQVGGALGVAVMGSIGSSLFHHGMASAVAAPAAAHDSVGAAVALASRLPAAQAQSLLADAHRAFIHGENVASLIAVGVALAGAVVAARFLPAPERRLLDGPLYNPVDRPNPEAAAAH